MRWIFPKTIYVDLPSFLSFVYSSWPGKYTFNACFVDGSLLGMTFQQKPTASISFHVLASIAVDDVEPNPSSFDNDRGSQILFRRRRRCKDDNTDRMIILTTGRIPSAFTKEKGNTKVNLGQNSARCLSAVQDIYLSSRVATDALNITKTDGVGYVWLLGDCSRAVVF
jgi:hypothetical protein